MNNTSPSQKTRVGALVLATLVGAVLLFATPATAGDDKKCDYDDYDDDYDAFGYRHDCRPKYCEPAVQSYNGDHDCEPKECDEHEDNHMEAAFLNGYRPRPEWKDECVEIPVFPTVAAGLFAVVGGGLAYATLARRR